MSDIEIVKEWFEEHHFDVLNQRTGSDHDYQALLNRLNKWQPIETAPKDGTEILLFIPAKNNDKDRDFVVAMNAGRFCWENDLDQRCDFDQTTHWMPLPTPPKE